MKKTCPACGMENATFDDKVGMFICPDCGHEWTEELPRTEKGSENIEIGPGD